MNNLFNYKSQKGAISYFVMMAMLFFLFIIIGVYSITSKRAQTQTQSLEMAQEKYYNENSTDIYSSKFADESAVIPIYTKEQLYAIGTGKKIEIEGKVYDFAETDINKYKLKNDIVINVSEYAENNMSVDIVKKINETEGYRIIIYGNEENVEIPEIEQEKFYALGCDEYDNFVYKIINGPEYGENISDLYENLYVSVDSQNPIEKATNRDGTFNGNFAYGTSLSAKIGEGDIVTNTTTNNAGHEMINSGVNTLTFSRAIEKNRWVNIHIYTAMNTQNVTLSNLELIFADGTKGNIESLANNDYIEKLVIASSVSSSEQYLFSNFMNIIKGGQTIGNYSEGFIFFKTKNKSNLTAINITSSKAFDTNYKNDGIKVQEYSKDIEISISPFKNW